MAKPAAVLLWGEDPFLLREAAHQVLSGVAPVEVDAGEWRGGETADLATPSLFGEARALLVTNAKQLPDQAIAELTSYLSNPSPEALLLISAQVASRAKAPAALLKLVREVGQVIEVKITRKDLPRWLGDRAASRDLDLTPDAAAALVETVGEDPAELDQAVAQLADAFTEQRVTRAEVAQQFRGLGEQRVWDLCDRVFERNLPASIRALRSLLEGRDDPLMILGGIAARLRDILRVKSLPDRMPLAEVARAAGLRFDWQARRYREQAARFTREELIRFHARVVEADRVLKSGGSGDVVLPVLVAEVVSAG